MSEEPDYKTARKNAGFRWGVGGTQDALRELTGIPIREFNLNPSACIEAYKKGRPLLRDMYGEDVLLPGVATPAISYGHVNGLGSELLFPEGGEVAHTHIYSSLEEGIAALRKPVDFAAAGMAPFFLDFRHTLQDAFPGEKVSFSYGYEGPITTAWELRGESFFMDIYDNPEATLEFLNLATESIIAFHCFYSKVNDTPAFNPRSGGMCDDISSMIPPHMWREFVLPYWDQYYSGITTGNRYAHVEDLRPAQLKYLEEAGLMRYDPSISPQLNPRIIYSECRIPFNWRLGSFHYFRMDCRDVEDFVFQAVADGASRVSTSIEGVMCNEHITEKVLTFIRAAKEAKQLLDDGASRKKIGGLVSESGRKKFWDHWFE